jgi:1-acyl-sn-glycerol-3-phosphate acyltransferase
MSIVRALRRSSLLAIGVVLRRVLHLDVSGREQVPALGHLLVVSNHTRRFFDPLLLAVTFPRELVMVAHVDFKRRPLAGLLVRLSNAVFVAPSLALGSGFVAQCERALAGGLALAIFPEGREMGGGFGAFRHGAAYLALRNRCPVVPAWIERHGIRRFSIAFGRPVVPDSSAMNRRALEAFTTRLQHEVRALGKPAAEEPPPVALCREA